VVATEAIFAGYGAFGSHAQAYILGASNRTLFFSTWYPAIFGPQLSLGVWYHVAVTNIGNQVTLYLNGTAVNSALWPSGYINTAGGSQFVMGRLPGPIGDGRRLQGAVDEVSIYNRALSAEEIRAIFDAGSLGKCTNVPPTVDAGLDATINEGSTFSSTGSFTDPDADTWTATVDYGDGSGEQPLGLDGKSFSLNHVYADNGVYTVLVTVDDGQGGVGTDTATVTVLNVAPTVGPINAPGNPVQVGTEILASAAFADPGILDTHTALWDWGDGSSSAGTVAETGGSGSAEGRHTYGVPGMYTVHVTVTDKDGASGMTEFQYVVVYDPEGGFVTGGGWIDSPLGAYVPDRSLTGRANFGFVCKYEKGASVPTGATEFQFRAEFQFKLKTGGLNFRSKSYDWLVIAGARALYKGVGTIDGMGNYGFMLSAIDAALTPSTDVDLFRIKIWDKTTNTLIYDTQLGAADNADPSTPIGGGSIVIHKAK